PMLAERIEVAAIDSVAQKLYRQHIGDPNIADARMTGDMLRDAAQKLGTAQFSGRFMETEWHDVVDAWQLTNWAAYRDVRRLGRQTRLPEAKRKILWAVFARTRELMAEQGLVTMAMLYRQFSDRLSSRTNPLYG